MYYMTHKEFHRQERARRRLDRREKIKALERRLINNPAVVCGFWTVVLVCIGLGFIGLAR